VPGTISVALLATLLRDPSAAKRRPLDVVGLGLLIAGVGSLQYLLSEGERYDWFSDPGIVLSAAVAVLGIGGLIAWELRFAKTPVVDIAILGDRSVLTGVGLALIIGAALLGTQYVLPQYVQNSLGFTATLSGLLVLVKALPIALMTLAIVPLLTRIDPRFMIAIGFAGTALSSVWLGVVTTSDSSFGTFVVSLMIAGASVAMMFIPISVTVLGAVSRERGGSASAWINLAIQLGGSISVALLSMLVDRRFAFHQSVLAGSVNPSAVHLSTVPTIDQLAALAGQVASQAYVLAYADTSYAVAIFAAIAIPLVFLIRKPRTGGEVEFGG